MSVSEITGPLLVTGQTDTVGNANPDLGPSGFWGGNFLTDWRFAYSAGAPGDPQVLGLMMGQDVIAIDQAPSAVATANIAALQNVTNGTAMTLVSASGSGITVTTSATTILQTGKVVPSGALAIDGLPALVTFGVNKSVQLSDPTKSIARAVSITGSTSATGGAFLVTGYDLYGNLQTETVTAGAGAVTTDGAKTFKFITKVVPQFTDAHNYSVGTADIFGFPLRVDTFAYARIAWNNGVITANTGFTAADTTSPATATTGDVRGTYATQSASDGTKKLQVFLSLPVANLQTLAGYFGVTPA